MSNSTTPGPAASSPFHDVPGSPRRRSVLRGLGLGALGLASAPMLASCGSGSGGTVSAAGDAELPTYKALADTGLTPDLPETEDGVPAAFFTYPEPFDAVAEKPLSGEKFTALAFLFGAAPNPREKNTAWQAVEEQLGGTVDITAVGDADYATKVNTTLASSSLPDIMVDDGASFPDIDPFLEEACVDLTEHLGGDKISAYPNLQAIPQIFWEQCVSNGRLFFLPVPRNITGGLGVVNGGLLQERVGIGSTEELRDLDDFEEAARELTAPDENRWAFGATKFGLSMFRGMFDVPNGWRLEGDDLIHQTETDEYIAMLEFVKKLVDAGCFAPGSDGWTKSQMQDGFISGKTAMIYDGMPSILKTSGYAAALPKVNSEWSADPILPFGDGVAYADNITVARTLVTAGDGSTERVEAILRMMDYLAAPFGSREFLLINYGAEGEDYTLDDGGNPQATDQGVNNTSVPWKYLTAPTQALFDPGNTEAVKKVHSAFEKEIPIAVEDPTSTIYSPTNASKSSQISQPVGDAVQNFLAGRGTLDQVTSAVKTWASEGGDDIRAEYLEGISAVS